MKPAMRHRTHVAAALGSATATALLLLFASPSLGQAQITLTPATLSVAAGGANTLTACINTVQQTNTTVAITQTGPPGVIGVPVNTTILAGNLCASFAVNGLALGGPVTVTATLPPVLGGGSDSSQVTVTALGISIVPSDVALQAAASADLTIVLSAAAPFGGAPVNVLQAGPAGVIDFTWTDPAPPHTVHPHVNAFLVTIPAGSSTFTFSVNALAAGGPVTVNATLPPGLGQASAVAEVTVNPHAFPGFTVPGGGLTWVDVNPGAINPRDSAFMSTNGLQVPAGAVFPHGAVRLHATGFPPGAVVAFTWGVPPNPPLAGAQLWKLARTAPPATVPAAVFGAGTVQWTVQDGGPLDADGAANGEIVDPAAIALQASDIPLLGNWGTAILLVALALAGVIAVRRFW